MKIPIVVVAYNRPHALSRLLDSLNRAEYPDDVEIVISIDGGELNAETIKVSEQFAWKHGTKKLIVADNNQGLRQHILKCGSLTDEYDGIILLEDDLVVSPYFYSYAIEAQKYYDEESSVAGVALFSHAYNETAWLPFLPVEDGSDVFFLQVPCSWGQCWTSRQWSAFKSWYDKNSELVLDEDKDIPPDVRLWPDTSWKKYFFKYMVEHDLFFVYPRVGLSTNFADAGVNHAGTNNFQVSLLMSSSSFIFSSYSESFAKYDSYCEMLPESLRQIMKKDIDREFAVDLYGMKNFEEIPEKYVITSQKLSDAEFGYARRMRPHELNVAFCVEGDDIFFGETGNLPGKEPFLSYRNKINQDYEKTHAYWYRMSKFHYRPIVVPRPAAGSEDVVVSIKQLLRMLFSELRRRIFSRNG